MLAQESRIGLYAVLFVAGLLVRRREGEIPASLQVLTRATVPGASGFAVLLESFADNPSGFDISSC